MEDAGQKLKRVRERLGLKYRDVEQASLSIAQRHDNDEYAIALSRLSDIENKGTIPTIYRVYSLCAIYRLDLMEVLQWYGVDPSAIPAEAGQLELEKTHLLRFIPNGFGNVEVPLALDPGIDLRKTTHLSRMIQRWGTLPLMLLKGLDVQSHRYAYLGSEDWTMYPLLWPGSLLMIDETRRKPVDQAYATELERPIYFFEHRLGFSVGWCSLGEGQIIVQPHPLSGFSPQIFDWPNEIEIIGQVSGIAMRLDRVRRPRIRA